MTEHKSVEIVHHLCMIGMVPKVDGIFPVPVELSCPNGKMKFIPQQIKLFFNCNPIKKIVAYIIKIETI